MDILQDPSQEVPRTWTEYISNATMTMARYVSSSPPCYLVLHELPSTSVTAMNTYD